MTTGDHVNARPSPFLRRLPGPVSLIVAAVALGYVAHVVAQHTIEVVDARRLLPRWDLATHLVQGWLDYHLLATGQIPRLLWDLWLQGYWPPMLSLYQVPFYLVLGGGMASGLWSSLVAFVLTGLAGSALIWCEFKQDSALPASVFLALLVSSPFLLAYASVPMTEMLGALTQLLVLLAYVHYRHNRTPAAARLFAISLTILFFTKYNYFILLAAPLVVLEWLERTSGSSAVERATMVWRWALRLVSTPSGAFVCLYLAALLAIVVTGGFDFRVLGRRVSVHTIGNSGHLVLYVVLGRLWYLHRRGRIHWDRVMSLDPRVRALLIWFALPVTVWMASPYPNHIRDFANLVFNRPLGASTVEAGAATYLDALRTLYFYDARVLVSVVVVFTIAAVQYRRQPPLMRWLILAVPLQLAAIALHQTRFPRFLLLTVVLLCLAAAHEMGRWIAGRGRVAGMLLGPVILAAGVLAAREVVAEPRFRAIAFENYSDSETLRVALESIRAELTGADRLAIVGQGNDLSPGLFRWQLGPPSGAPCFPYELGGAKGIDVALATRVLVIDPLGPDSGALDATSYYVAQRERVMERVVGGEFVSRREIPLPDIDAIFRLYDRTSTSAPTASCQ